MYVREISLTDETLPFSKEEIDGIKAMINNINQSGQDGRAAFFLRKALV